MKEPSKTKIIRESKGVFGCKNLAELIEYAKKSFGDNIDFSEVLLNYDEDYIDNGDLHSYNLCIEIKKEIPNPDYDNQMKKYDKEMKKCQQVK